MALVAARVQGDFFRRSMPPRPTGEGAAGPIAKLLEYLWIHKRFKSRPDGEPGLY